MYCLLYAVLWILTHINIVSAQTSGTYMITTPNVFRLGAKETVSVSISNVTEPVKVQLYLQTYPSRRQPFSNVEAIVSPDEPKLLTVQIRPEDLPSNTAARRYVYLVAMSTSPALRFRQEALVLINQQSGYVFIQTDKPIYTPNQQVKMRIIHLDQDMRPSPNRLTLDILNPEGTVVERFSNLSTESGFIIKTFPFPPFPMFGNNWTVVAYYGDKYQFNKTVRFSVKEYVLPTFSVQINAPNFIYPSIGQIEGTVKAKYVYGKPVEGALNMQYGISNHYGDTIIFLKHQRIKLANGDADFKIYVDHIKDLGKDFWFPENAKLYIHAEVIEKTTGQKVSTSDSSALFVRTPFEVSFAKSLKNFKPGLPYIAVIDVAFANKKPVFSIPVELKVTAQLVGGKEMDVRGINPMVDQTSENGRVEFMFDMPQQAERVVMFAQTVRTNQFYYQRANATLIVKAYQSSSNSFLSLSVNRAASQVDRDLEAEALTTYADTTRLLYMVISKGRIVKQGSVTKDPEDATYLPVQVSHDMVPSARLLVYFIDKQGKVVADSLWIDVEDKCKNEVTLSPDKPVYNPGQRLHLKVNGQPNSLVGILAVDRAVYLLNDKDRLTRQKLFNTMDSYDLGCGAGGGDNVEMVFKNAGVSVITNAALASVRRNHLGCGQMFVPDVLQRRKRRSPAVQPSFLLRERERCCSWGRRTAIPAGLSRQKGCYMEIKQTSGRSLECKKAFFDCCKNSTNGQGLTSQAGRSRALAQTEFKGMRIQLQTPEYFPLLGNRGRSSLMNPDPIIEQEEPNLEGLELTFDHIDENEEEIAVRSYFPETWLFEDYELDSTGSATIREYVPDSITTWALQAVGVDQHTGMCVAQTQNITVFKKFFIQLHMPYSVIRGEQIEIVATVFNYFNTEIPFKIYMEGTENICYGAQPGDRSPSKDIRVGPHDSHSVSYPIVPLAAGEFKIKLLAFTPSVFGADIIEKTLRVKPEGMEVTKVKSMLLDPAGKIKPRNRRSVDGEQVDVIDVSPPVEAIEGSENCTVSAVGSILGPSVEVYIQGAESFLQMPTGCGEQTMIYMAPTLFATEYLRKTGQMTPEIESKAFKYITEGYTRELDFKKKDGSYGAWKHYPSSTWLTAFVMKNFCRAKQYVFVDPKVLCSGLKWLPTQQRKNGAFFDYNPVMNAQLLGGVNGDASLTAFVLISLLECQAECQDDVIQQSRVKAVRYLENQLPFITRPYAHAITAYTLAKARSSYAPEVNEKLKKLSQYDEESNSRWWGVDPTKVGADVPYWYQHNPKAVSVEMTAYALLTQLEMGDLGYSHPIVVWLTEQRGKRGEFVSTQDTVVALQALSEYASRVQSPLLDLNCEVTSAVDTSFKKRMRIKRENAEVQQEVVAPTGGKLFIDTRGTGIGQLKVEMRYHVPTAKGEICRFNLTVASKEKEVGFGFGVFGDDPSRTSSFGGSPPPANLPSAPSARFANPQHTVSNPDCDEETRSRSRTGFRSRSRIGLPRCRRKRSGSVSSYNIEIEACVRYLVPGQSSGMTILEVGLFTGFKAVQADLEKLKQNKKIQHFETADRLVVLYLEKVSSEQDFCYKFEAQQENRVGNTQPVAVRVYDYYSPDISCTEFYHPKDNSPLLRYFCDQETGQCQCAEGKCSQCYGHIAQRDTTPLVHSPLSYGKMYRRLCGWRSTKPEADHAFKVKVISRKTENGFTKYTLAILKVLKNGVEEFSAGDQMVVESRASCKCPMLRENYTYLIMGKDGIKHMDKHGNTRCKYFLNEKTYIIEWLETSRAGISRQQRRLARWLHRFVDRMERRNGNCVR